MLNSSINPQSKNIRTDALSISSDSNEKSSNFILPRFKLDCVGIIESCKNNKKHMNKVKKLIHNKYIVITHKV